MLDSRPYRIPLDDVGSGSTQRSMTHRIDLRELSYGVETQGSATHSAMSMRLMDLKMHALNDPGCSTARLLRLVMPVDLASSDCPVTTDGEKYDLEGKTFC